MSDQPSHPAITPQTVAKQDVWEWVKFGPVDTRIFKGIKGIEKTTVIRQEGPWFTPSEGLEQLINLL